MYFDYSEIALATGEEVLITSNSQERFNINTDSRTVSKDNVFLALSGQSFDGHNFVFSAIDKGCKGFIIDKTKTELISQIKDKVDFILISENTLITYLKIARYFRNKVAPKVIAITGSSGKTTTKEIIYSVVSQKFKSHKTKLNHNNEIGLCQTLLNMPVETECCVVEMGMRGLGEIQLLSEFAVPDVAVITNVGTAHIGRLGSEDNIAVAKAEITNYLSKDGVLIAHDSELLKKNLKWQAQSVFYDIKNNNTEILSATPEGSVFMYKNNTYELKVSGEYNILNSLSAIETGLYLGMTPDEINEGLKSYQPIENRWEVFNHKSGATIINDSYNANPESVKASIEAICTTYKNKKINVLLGDMGELGEHEHSLHKEVGAFASTMNLKSFLTLGELTKISAEEFNAKKINEIQQISFNEHAEVVEYLKLNLTDNDVLLLKASRFMKFDEIANQLR
ncbi:MAG: UDP-N-acetylmuramoyl-tripeptide--D-alanyl-D-alanine ligase [bacterium]